MAQDDYYPHNSLDRKTPVRLLGYCERVGHGDLCTVDTFEVHLWENECASAILLALD